MLENPELLKEMVDVTGAHQTNEESPEEVDHLIAKAKPYAEAWAPVAEEIWAEQKHRKPTYENYTEKKREDASSAAFDGADEQALKEDLAAAIESAKAAG